MRMLAVIVGVGVCARGWIVFSAEQMPGVNGAYSLVQTRSLIEKGTLGLPDFPLTFVLQAGVAWLQADATERAYEESEPLLGEENSPTAFSGESKTWSLQGVWKWAPEGNSRERSLKLQGEYFSRTESGQLTQSNAVLGEGLMDFRGSPGGWYLQSVYQFMPSWRLGLRYDSLDSGNSRLRSQDGVLRPAAFPSLAAYDPERSSLMLDWSPTEFSRIRLQLARDKSREGLDDDQIYLQYIMSLGAHGAHQF